MDGFPSLPIELPRLILVEAVEGRGLKCATRLRFVCKSWNPEVLDAIIQSSIIDSFNINDLFYNTSMLGEPHVHGLAYSTNLTYRMRMDQYTIPPANHSMSTENITRIMSNYYRDDLVRDKYSHPIYPNILRTKSCVHEQHH